MNDFFVETAGNGQIALQMFCKKEPFYYDAILMDIHMPVLDGIETTKSACTFWASTGEWVSNAYPTCP